LRDPDLEYTRSFEQLWPRAHSCGLVFATEFSRFQNYDVTGNISPKCAQRVVRALKIDTQ